MNPSIFRYAWEHTKRDQLWLLFVVLVSLPFYFMSLDLPKRIIDGPIRGAGHTEAGTWTAMQLSFTWPTWLGGSGESVMLLDGVQLDRVPMLVYLCGLFLFFVLVNGLIKYYISTYKGRLGERMLRRIRYELVDRLLRFPMTAFRRIRPSEVATMVKDEVEPLGGFIGEAFVTPALLVSQAAVAMLFIMLQSLPLGLVAGAVVAVQVIIIPRLRRRLLILGRQRQLTARQLAGRVGEVVESISAIRTNDTSNWERADISSRLAKIFFIRFDIYQWKFMVKFLNNLLAQVTPFIFYLAGGYLVIQGQLEIGQLVAVIAAYKDLPAPLKELIDWDQIRLDVQVKYTTVVEQFAQGKVLDQVVQKVDAEAPPRISREIAAVNLAIRDESGGSLLEPTTLRLTPGEAVAAVGAVGAGGEYLAEAFARLAEPSSGRVQFDGTPIDTLPEAFTGRRTAYVESGTYFPQSSLRDALLYSLRHVPVRPATKDERAEARRRAEARKAGNIDLDIADDWIDYEAAGASGPEDLLERMCEVLELVGLEDDVYRQGLRSPLPADAPEPVVAGVLEARRDFRRRLEQAGAELYVETFDPGRYIANASVLENLIFGVLVPGALGGQLIERHPYMVAVLAETGLEPRLIEMGRQIAEALIDLFGDMAPDNPLLERMDLLSAEDIDRYRAILRRVAVPGAVPDADDRYALLRLAFGYVEPRHRLGLLDEPLREAVLAARRAFRERLPEELAGAVYFYEPDALNPAASLQDNVLFGRVVDVYADATQRTNTLLHETLDALDLSPTIVALGLEMDIGSGAKRLSPAQRQKLALARALLKRPDLLVVNRALSALDGETQQAIIDRVLERSRSSEDHRHATFWVLSNPAHAASFDKVATFENGRLVGHEHESAAESLVAAQ